MAQRIFRALLFTIACVCGLNSAQAQGFSFDTESTFLQLHTSNGNNFGNNATGYEIGQRYQLSYINPDYLGPTGHLLGWDHNGFTPAGAGLLRLKLTTSMVRCSNGST